MRFFGDLGVFAFNINGKPFKYILNNRHYRNLCDTMIFILFQSQQNIDKTGKNIQELKVDDPNVIREYKLFKEYSKYEPALSEMLDYWDIVKKDIITKIEQISTPYIGSNDNEENVQDAQGDGDDALKAGIDNHTRQSYEFSQFSRATAQIKHFFARIPAVRYAYDERGERLVDEKGNSIYEMIGNSSGLPHFVDAKKMYNLVLNQVYNCRSLSELLQRI